MSVWPDDVQKAVDNTHAMGEALRAGFKTITPGGDDMILQDGSQLRSIEFYPDADGGCEAYRIGPHIDHITLFMLGSTPWAAVWDKSGNPPTCYNLVHVKAVEAL